MNIDGEKLLDLGIASDVALTTKDVKEMEHQLNSVDAESLEVRDGSQDTEKKHQIYDKYLHNRQHTNTRWDRNREGDYQ